MRNFGASGVRRKSTVTEPWKPATYFHTLLHPSRRNHILPMASFLFALPASRVTWRSVAACVALVNSVWLYNAITLQCSLSKIAKAWPILLIIRWPLSSIRSFVPWISLLRYWFSFNFTWLIMFHVLPLIFRW